MKHCIECGAQLSDEAQFCINCGADVEPPATDNTPDQVEGIENNTPEENLSNQLEAQAVPQQPIPQKPPMYSQQPEVYQQPAQQQPMAPQQSIPQQPTMYPQAAPEQPMPQQPGMYQPQPMSQPQPMYPQPAQNRGSSNKTLLYVLIPLIAIGAVVAILFATGVFSGKKDAPKSDQQETVTQVQPSEQDQEESEEEIQPTALQTQSVTLGGITFPLAEDYEVQERTTLNDGEACLIVPKGASDRANRLILRVYPSMLEGIDGITNEEIGDMLRDVVDTNAGVLANTEKTGFKLDREYKIHYDDNADGSYFPHCYTYLNWTDRNGKHSRSYTEATLVKRAVLSGSAIANDEGELQALTDIYAELVQAANK